jgi:hypothetical protein
MYADIPSSAVETEDSEVAATEAVSAQASRTQSNATKTRGFFEIFYNWGTSKPTEPVVALEAGPNGTETVNLFGVKIPMDATAASQVESVVSVWSQSAREFHEKLLTGSLSFPSGFPTNFPHAFPSPVEVISMGQRPSLPPAAQPDVATHIFEQTALATTVEIMFNTATETTVESIRLGPSTENAAVTHTVTLSDDAQPLTTAVVIGRDAQA